MALEIKTTEIGTDLYAQCEKFFDGEDIATASTFTSSKVRFHQSLGRAEAKIIAGATFTLADTETITLTCETSATEGGSFVREAEIGKITASGATVITKGDVLGSYIRPAEKVDTYYAQFKITTSGAQTGATADGYIVEV
jgi:hypothetical protein